jgi:ubiquinone/menaquinone biosynthesis C-methylase UbiE
MASDDRGVLDEQIAYYRARAAEYDATSTPEGDPFASTFEHVLRTLDEFAPRGRVLELAAGTGQWTAALARHAHALTATDASPEMLEINAAKVGGPSVSYRLLDAFDLAPDPTWDVVFFGFFLSHVPMARFDRFWKGIRGLLAPRGRVIFVDEAAHPDRKEEWEDARHDTVWRTLQDGTRHRAVKVLWQPRELERRLDRIGWDASVTEAEPFFYLGLATPRAG